MPSLTAAAANTCPTPCPPPAKDRKESPSGRPFSSATAGVVGAERQKDKRTEGQKGKGGGGSCLGVGGEMGDVVIKRRQVI